MNAQRLLTASLDWKLVMTKAGVRFSEQTTKAVNSLVEYLCAAAEIETDQCDLPGCEAGVSYSSELKEDAKLQTKLDCEQDAAKEYS